MGMSSSNVYVMGGFKQRTINTNIYSETKVLFMRQLMN